MKLTIKQALKIKQSKKDFLVYLLDNQNKLDRYILTNDLTRHRKDFGINSKFTLLDIIKPQIEGLTINI